MSAAVLCTLCVLCRHPFTPLLCRYMYISSDDKVVRAKKGTGGLHLVKTVQAIIIASYAEPVTAEQCAVVTEKLGDYLVSVGY